MPGRTVTTKIQIPKLPEFVSLKVNSRTSEEKKFNAGLSRIKYIVVIKISESSKRYRKNGRLRRSRDYAVGILTEENDYYFSTLSIFQIKLIRSLVDLFRMMFINRFIITEKTHLLMTDNIGGNEPLCMFLDIVRSATMMDRSNVDLNKVFKGVNRYYKYTKVWKHRKFGKWHWELLINDLYEHKCFGFIDNQEEWWANLKTMHPLIRDMNVYVAVCIIYLRTKDVYYSIRQRYIKRKEEKLKEQKLKELEDMKPERQKEIAREKRDQAPWNVVL